jgi:Domain of unknown function (DUF4142)
MITKLGLTLSLAMLFAPSCFAQDAASQKFLNEAIEGNFAEVQMGQLAKKQASSDGVRAFGEMLEKDHSTAKASVALGRSLFWTPCGHDATGSPGAGINRNDGRSVPDSNRRHAAHLPRPKGICDGGRNDSSRASSRTA